MEIKSVYEIRQPNGEVETKTINKVGEPAATAMLKKAKEAKLFIKGFLINGIFKAVDLRDHFRRMADKYRQ